MAIAARSNREEKFKWLIQPFMFAFSACLMAALFGVSIATDATVPDTYVITGLIASLIAISGLVVWGIIRMRATFEG